MTRKTPLSVYVNVDTSQQRMSRIWGRIAERAERPRRSWWVSRWVVASVGVVAVVASVAVMLWSSDHHSPSAWQGATLQTASDALSVELEDGSRLSLEARTRVAVEESSDKAVVLRLSQGRVHCDVAPNRSRPFAVLTHGVRVLVTGTRFSVEVSDGGRVNVQVESGTVEVTPPGSREARQLSAGEAWSLDTEVTRLRAESPAEALTAEASEHEPERLETGTDVPQAPETNDGATLAQRSRPQQPAATEGRAPDARQLLEQGTTARRAGDAQQAAQYYERLLQLHPSDPRAGLAAFELGRLRMDRLGNLQGAVNALRQAVTLAPGSGFREDAMARLVQAYAAMGSVGPCRQARRAYLEAFPSGVHAASVAQKCPSP